MSLGIAGRVQAVTLWKMGGGINCYAVGTPSCEGSTKEAACGRWADNNKLADPDRACGGCDAAIRDSDTSAHATCSQTWPRGGATGPVNLACLSPEIVSPDGLTCGPPPPPCTSGEATDPAEITIGWKSRPFGGSWATGPSVPDTGCSGGCTVAMQPSSGSCAGGGVATALAGDICVTQTPSSTGLYRATAFYSGVKNGSNCSASASPGPSASNSPSPPCGGSIGTVNGVTICVPNSPASSTTTSTTTVPATATTPATSTTTSTTTTTPAGGGTGAAGGTTTSGGTSTTTTSPNSATGGSTATTVSTTPARSAPPAGSGGSGSDVVVCGVPGSPPCKIDETGTPTAAGAYDTATAALDASNAAVISQIGSVSHSKTAADFDIGFGINLPASVSCTDLKFGVRGREIDIPICEPFALVRSLVGWFFYIVTGWLLFGIVVNMERK